MPIQYRSERFDERCRTLTVQLVTAPRMGPAPPGAGSSRYGAKEVNTVNIRLTKETVWRVERLEAEPEHKEREADAQYRSTDLWLVDDGSRLQKHSVAVGSLRSLL